MNLIRVLWCRFHQCLCMFTMLVVEGSSETGRFKYLSEHVFGVRNFGNTKSMRMIFFFKILKIYCKYQKCSKKFRKKKINFWDICIWIGIVKLSWLTTRFFSSAANVLTSSRNICHVNKRNVSQLNWLGSDQWIS